MIAACDAPGSCAATAGGVSVMAAPSAFVAEGNDLSPSHYSDVWGHAPDISGFFLPGTTHNMNTGD